MDGCCFLTKKHPLWLTLFYFISLFLTLTVQWGVLGSLDSAEDQSFFPCGTLSRASSSFVYSQLTGCTEVFLFFLFPKILVVERKIIITKKGQLTGQVPVGNSKTLLLLKLLGAP